jgi:phenylacetate-CoA ligase
MPDKMTTNSFDEKLIKQTIEELIPENELRPQSVEDVIKLSSFFEKIKICEARFNKKYAALDHSFQKALTLRRLQQITNIALLNPLWKERINQSGLKNAPATFEEWQKIPLCDKNSIRDFFAGNRSGMVVPISRGGFEIVASGGTSSGMPSEIVYSLNELHDTYKIAGDFIGNFMLKDYLAGDAPKWMFTTLADYQMWSSGTMVGGVLQHIPGVNYIGAGPIMAPVFQQIMSYDGPKAFMGISQGVGILTDLGVGLSEEARNSFRVAMYGSGVLPQRKQAELKEMYPNLAILSYFAATQAETIGLQLSADSPFLASVPGLHLVEIVDENGNWVKEGEEGELVVTRLHATEAPVLRFKIGDRMIRRPNIDSQDLKTEQFEFAGRSGDVIHLCDTQYPVSRVYDSVCDEFTRASLFDIKTVAHEVQFINQRKMKTLTMLISVDDPAAAATALQYKYGLDDGRHLFIQSLIHSLSIFNQGEANLIAMDKTEYQFNIRFVEKMSTEIVRTDVGKVPMLRDIL